MKRMNNTIVMTGGGSGGHLTPIISVAEVLKVESPTTKLIYVGQKGDGLGDIMHDHPVFDAVHTIHAGKLRRYHGEGWKQLLDVKTMLLNLRDVFLTAAGLVEAWFLLRKIRPKVILCKGGFVGVPVGLAAASLRVPYVTHDSDSLPGLANRIIARWARLHAVSMPKEIYRYPQDKTVTVGVPVQRRFRSVTPALQAAARESLQIPARAKVIFVIGGGLGARRVNDAVLASYKSLAAEYGQSLYVLHVAGRAGEQAVLERYQKLDPEAVKADRVRVFGFTNDVAKLSAAADAVITRAGATNMAEFAVQGKACIIVPNPVLTGGHQLKNASVYHKANAALVVLEDDLQSLSTSITQLLNNAGLRDELGKNLQALANTKAADSLAKLLLAVTERR